MDLGILLPVYLFLLGLVIGSFLNVVILRMATGIGLHGRSRCMSCGHTLTWKELIPFFSFVFLRGRCKECRSRISFQYPLVELLTAILFVLVGYFFPPVSIGDGIVTLIYLAIVSLLVVMAVYDFRHKILPDGIVYSFDLVSLLTVFVGGMTILHAPHIWTLSAGPILALPFAFIWLVSKGRWIGFGDAKLALGMGWLLGLNAGLNALILSFWIGAVVGVLWMFASYGKWKSRVEMPFGPFLILGTLLVLFWNIQVIDFRSLSILFESAI